MLKVKLTSRGKGKKGDAETEASRTTKEHQTQAPQEKEDNKQKGVSSA